MQDSGVGNEHWHRMVKLHVSEEATWLHDFVEDSLARFRQKATEALAKRDNGRKREADIQSGTDGRWTGGAETEFMCAHIRRQDFQESCARYEEEFRSGRWEIYGVHEGLIIDLAPALLTVRDAASKLLKAYLACLTLSNRWVGIVSFLCRGNLVVSIVLVVKSTEIA